MKKKKTPVALCYDFDGTLIRGNMQENSFISDIGMAPSDFWAEVKKNAERNDMDEVLSYMQIMLRKADEKHKQFNKQSIQEHGKNLDLFPGVEEWFKNIDGYAKTIGVNIDHYIISSGLDDMIRGHQLEKSSNIYLHLDLPTMQTKFRAFQPDQSITRRSCNTCSE
jgi:hypothetical protein